MLDFCWTFFAITTHHHYNFCCQWSLFLNKKKQKFLITVLTNFVTFWNFFLVLILADSNWRLLLVTEWFFCTQQQQSIFAIGEFTIFFFFLIPKEVEKRSKIPSWKTNFFQSGWFGFFSFWRRGFIWIIKKNVDKSTRNSIRKWKKKHNEPESLPIFGVGDAKLQETNRMNLVLKKCTFFHTNLLIHFVVEVKVLKKTFTKKNHGI